MKWNWTISLRHFLLTEKLVETLSFVVVVLHVKAAYVYIYTFIYIYIYTYIYSTYSREGGRRKREVELLVLCGVELVSVRDESNE